MTGIQALERIAPGLPMKPGKVERCEFEYRRHGTQTLIAAFDVTIGKVAGVIGDTRTEQDFARFLDTLLSSAAANTRWDIVVMRSRRNRRPATGARPANSRMPLGVPLRTPSGPTRNSVRPG